MSKKISAKWGPFEPSFPASWLRVKQKKVHMTRGPCLLMFSLDLTLMRLYIDNLPRDPSLSRLICKLLTLMSEGLHVGLWSQCQSDLASAYHISVHLKCPDSVRESSPTTRTVRRSKEKSQPTLLPRELPHLLQAFLLIWPNEGVSF